MPAKIFHFKSRTAMQAAAVLLDTERSRQMGYYRLLKLLYIADRKHLEQTGTPITGGRMVAMDKGPLSSAVYDVARREHPAYPEWAEFFRVEGRNIEMIEHPGNGELSKREIRTLLDVAEQLQDRDDEEIGAVTHAFQEYQDHHRPGTSTTIPLADIIDAVGRSEQKAAILQDAEETAVLDRIFGG